MTPLAKTAEELDALAPGWYLFSKGYSGARQSAIQKLVPSLSGRGRHNCWRDAARLCSSASLAGSGLLPVVYLTDDAAASAERVVLIDLLCLAGGLLGFDWPEGTEYKEIQEALELRRSGRAPC